MSPRRGWKGQRRADVYRARGFIMPDPDLALTLEEPFSPKPCKLEIIWFLLEKASLFFPIVANRALHRHVVWSPPFSKFLLLLEEKQVSSGKVELILVSECCHRSLCYLTDWFTLPWSVNPKAVSVSLYSSFIFVSLSPQCQSAGLLVCWLGCISEISVSPLPPPLGLPNVMRLQTALGRGSFSWLTLCFPLLPLGSAANRAHNWLVRS